MNYLEETDRWLDELFANFAGQKMTLDEVKRAIRERILQSYKNGLKAAPRGRASVPSQQSPERV